MGSSSSRGLLVAIAGLKSFTNYIALGACIRRGVRDSSSLHPRECLSRKGEYSKKRLGHRTEAEEFYRGLDGQEVRTRSVA